MIRFTSQCLTCDKPFDLPSIIANSGKSEISAELESKQDSYCPCCILAEERANEPQSMKNLRTDLDDGKNIVCVGPAGAGKSVILKKLVNQLLLRNPPVIFDVLCPTGCSALNVDGITLHSLFGWSPGRQKCGTGSFFGMTCSRLSKGLFGNDTIKERLDNALPRFKTGIKRLSMVSCLLFDEFSMIPYEVLHSMDRICRVLKGKLDSCFGGIQIILFGDPFQISPTQGKYPFDGPIWNELNLNEHQIGTDHLYRFTSTEFGDMTRMIRLGIVSRLVEGKFEERNQSPPEPLMELYFTNKDVEKYNKDRYSKLIEQEQLYPSTITLQLNINPSGKFPSIMATCGSIGKFELSELNGLDNWNVKISHKDILKYVNDELKHFQKNLIAVYGDDYMNLKFKVGTRVICTVNHKEDGRLLYSNGSAGIIRECKTDGIKITLDDCRIITVKPKLIERTRRIRLVGNDNNDNNDNEELFADIKLSFLHMPFRLGYAITFNRSQGMTLDRVNVNGKKLVRKTGMLYVGLSRCRALERLYLDGINLSKVKASGLALIKFQNHICKELQYLISNHSEWFDDFKIQLDTEELVQKIYELIGAIKNNSTIPRLNDVAWNLKPKKIRKIKNDNINGKESDEKHKEDDNDELIMPVFEATTKTQLTKIRGQSQRELRKWLIKNQGQCIITGETLIAALDVAHIKPYSEFTGDDLKSAHVFNGMLMRKDLHALYDKGYFAFDNDGNILSSKTFKLSNNYSMFIKVEFPFFVNREYIKWHRENIFNQEL